MGKNTSLDLTKLNPLINEQGLKRYWIAEQTGVHVTTLRRWLSGDIRRIKDQKILRLAQVLEINHDELLSKCSPN